MAPRLPRRGDSPFASGERTPNNPSELQDRFRPDDRIWFCVRRRGAVRRSGWTGEAPLRELPSLLGARQGATIEVCVAGEFRPVAPADRGRVLRKRDRGVLGIEFTYRGEVVRLAPTRMLAANRGFERALETFLLARNADLSDFEAHGGLRTFEAQQFLLAAGDETGVTELYRGSPLVAPEGVDGEDRAAAVADGITRWMLRNLSADGALPYKYWPSRGAESAADNAIRRFLASLALARMGKLRGSEAVRAAARRNLKRNLERYFQNLGDGRGAIVERAGAKLGAAAIAALAILESPAPGEFLEELRLLAAGVASLVDDRVGFRTFFFPPERDGDNWNFYAGEALLFWAEAGRWEAPGAPTPERWFDVFRRCRDRHRRARNPAFVPWQTQACASMFEQTRRRELADFVLEMNDWLLPMQQWGVQSGLPPDLWGRFYSPGRPEFGPPHAASTGVYLEGLADATKLARAIDDTTRATLYERAVRRGFRSLRQLQFRDERDAFYVSRRGRVLGALRTEAYDNAVRVDSAAHALAAAVKVLEQQSQPASANA